MKTNPESNRKAPPLNEKRFGEIRALEGEAEALDNLFG